MNNHCMPDSLLPGTWYQYNCACGVDARVEGNLVVNKGELQYYDYSIAVSSPSLLASTHACT